MVVSYETKNLGKKQKKHSAKGKHHTSSNDKKLTNRNNRSIWLTSNMVNANKYADFMINADKKADFMFNAENFKYSLS